MNITFLIGNGFDLNCGLKSSYKDVYNGYCKTKENDSELIKKFKKDCETWGEFEMSMAKNINKFETEDDFIKCLKNFKEYLNFHLTREEKFFEEKFKIPEIRLKIKREFENSIYTFYQNITPNITNNIINQIKDPTDITYNFVVFNYTGILNKILKLLDSISANVVHIHGSLQNDDPILGVDNEKQLILKDFDISEAGRLHFIKPFFNNEYDIIRVNQARNAILGSNILCVYGMSLGESDLSWKNLIIQWLNPPLSNRHLFVYDYESICNYKNIMGTGVSKADLLLEEMKAKRKYIKEKLNIEKEHINYEKYFKEIHMPFKNIFNINDIINKEEINIKMQNQVRRTAYNQQINS